MQVFYDSAIIQTNCAAENELISKALGKFMFVM